MSRARCRRPGQSLQGTLTTGQPEGLLLARVPVYGPLRFLDRTGRPTDKGISVGDEWTYRSYIEGSDPGRRCVDL